MHVRGRKRLCARESGADRAGRLRQNAVGSTARGRIVGT